MDMCKCRGVTDDRVGGEGLFGVLIRGETGLVASHKNLLDHDALGVNIAISNGSDSGHEARICESAQVCTRS